MYGGKIGRVKWARQSTTRGGEMLRIGDADIFGAEVNAACKLGEEDRGPTECRFGDDHRHK